MKCDFSFKNQCEIKALSRMISGNKSYVTVHERQIYSNVK